MNACASGTLRASDNFVVGNVYGKVRAMFDDRGNSLEEAPPSTPVEILGMEGLPQAGDQFVVVADRDKARGISEYREQKAREATLAKSSGHGIDGACCIDQTNHVIASVGNVNISCGIECDAHRTIQLSSGRSTSVS